MDGQDFWIEEATIEQIQLAFAENKLTSRRLVDFYLCRIEELNPELRAVVEVNPAARELADVADSERVAGKSPGGLHGVPVLLKDTIGTRDGLNTTAGSYALLGSEVTRDASVVERLRKAGAVVLGKASMSEWYRIRSLDGVPNGWCARAGQGVNPYLSSGTPCGSSSGSAISVAANMVAVALGTETHSSIICPSDHNSVVGLKPTVGLTSRAGVVPCSPRWDTVGPICRTVADAVYVLDVIAGFDLRDEATKEASRFVPEGGYKQFLNKEGLRGKRLGVVRSPFVDKLHDSAITAAFENHLNTLRERGAIVVDHLHIEHIDSILNPHHSGELLVMMADFKMSINSYLKEELVNSPVKSLAEIIAFNNNNPELEKLAEYGQESFLEAEKTNGIGERETQVLKVLEKFSKEGFEKLMKVNNLDVMVTHGSRACAVLAIGGYPGITVPAGYDSEGMPFGLCFGGLKGTEPKLIEVAYGFEQATKIRKLLHLVILALTLSGCRAIITDAISIKEATVSDLQRALRQNQLTSRQLVLFYLGEIRRLNPVLKGVIEVNPDALYQADRADAERRAYKSGSLHVLHSILFLLKDNIGTKDKLNTTAGSFALLKSIVPRDAGVASLSERAKFRSLTAPNGFSAREGQGKNPCVLSADPCGSSSGPAISVAANMAAVSLGTETDGSILCSESSNAVVGIKPTVGLTSQAVVIPVSPRQDTIGKLEAIIFQLLSSSPKCYKILDAIVGFDDNDAEATREALKYIPYGGYAQFLKVDGLKAKRIGILRNTFFNFGKGSALSQAFEYHFQTLRQSGAVLVGNLEIANILDFTVSGEAVALASEFKLPLNAYLKELVASPVRSLSDVIAFNQANAGLEKPEEFRQDIFLLSESTNGIGVNEKNALANLARLTRDGFLKVMTENRLDALDVPFGISFGGLKGSGPKLIEIAYGFEQATKIRRPPSFKPQNFSYLQPNTTAVFAEDVLLVLIKAKS
ncbi:hypothetical protein NMG60_11019464 [Bertholletia excelsa]